MDYHEEFYSKIG